MALHHISRRQEEEEVRELWTAAFPLCLVTYILSKKMVIETYIWKNLTHCWKALMLSWGETYQYRGIFQKFIGNPFLIYTSADKTYGVRWPAQLNILGAWIFFTSNQRDKYNNHSWQQTTFTCIFVTKFCVPSTSSKWCLVDKCTSQLCFVKFWKCCLFCETLSCKRR